MTVYIPTLMTNHLIDFSYRGSWGEITLRLFKRRHWALWGFEPDMLDGSATYTGPDIAEKFKSRAEAEAYCQDLHIPFVDSEGIVCNEIYMRD